MRRNIQVLHGVQRFRAHGGGLAVKSGPGSPGSQTCWSLRALTLDRLATLELVQYASLELASGRCGCQMLAPRCFHAGRSECKHDAESRRLALWYTRMSCPSLRAQAPTAHAKHTELPRMVPFVLVEEEDRIGDE